MTCRLTDVTAIPFAVVVACYLSDWLEAAKVPSGTLGK